MTVETKQPDLMRTYKTPTTSDSVRRYTAIAWGIFAILFAVSMALILIF